jgi:hypothetical protein
MVTEKAPKRGFFLLRQLIYAALEIAKMPIPKAINVNPPTNPVLSIGLPTTDGAPINKKAEATITTRTPMIRPIL